MVYMLTETEIEVLHKLAEKPPDGNRWYASTLANEINRSTHGVMKIFRKFEDNKGRILEFPWIKLTKKTDKRGRVVYYAMLTKTGRNIETLLREEFKRGDIIY